jgi:hypothetical protein
MKQVWRAVLTILGTAVLSAQAGPVLAQDGAEEHAFAERFLPDLRAALPDAIVTSVPDDPLQFVIDTGEDESPNIINLHRMFDLCQRISDAECRAELARFIAVMTREADAPLASNLRVIVRNAEYWSNVTAMMAETKTQPLHRRLGEDLYALLALDSADRIAVINAGALEDMGLKPEEAWARAEQQTRALFDSFPPSIELIRQPIVFEGPDYAGSMLFALAEWEALAADVGRELLVAAPSDQFMFAALVRDGEELDSIRRLVADDCAAAPRCLSPNAYRLRDGEWMIAK